MTLNDSVHKQLSLAPRVCQFHGGPFTIYLFVVAACLSAVGLSLALLTLIFAQDANWAWLALLAVAAFWLSGGILIYVGGRRSRPAREVSK
jgi:hypothetical protein